MVGELTNRRDPEIDQYLDSTELDHGLSLPVRVKLLDLLQDDKSYAYFSQAILSPDPSLPQEKQVQRSYRAMATLVSELERRPGGPSTIDESFMNPSQAGLLCKDILASLGGTATASSISSLKTSNSINLYHTRKLLDALLRAYPASIISAVCAGGLEGMDRHLGPLLRQPPLLASQTIPTLTSLVLRGCTGRSFQTSAERTLQQQQEELLSTSSSSSSISTGPRRKFVRSLTQWGFLTKLMECIIRQEYVESAGEEICESILTIVECIGYPPTIAIAASATSNQQQQDAGESDLVQVLCSVDWWEPLVEQVQRLEFGSKEEEAAAVVGTKLCAARVMMGIFALCTGSSSRVRKSKGFVDQTEQVETKAITQDNSTDEPQQQNKLLEWGLTERIHTTLITLLPRLCQAIRGQTQQHMSTTTVYWPRGEEQTKRADAGAVAHPGRCTIIPFTSWRLQLIILVAEIVTFDPSNDRGRKLAMDTIMELSLPRELQQQSKSKKNKKPKGHGEAAVTTTANDVVPSEESNHNLDVGTSLNPWPILCDFLFAYPETNLYHVQFLRLFQTICMEHHESTLRLVLQKVKFVARAIQICRGDETETYNPLRGILLHCLNTLRLQCQTLPPRAFLRQYLSSHDAWKAFLPTLMELTKEQQFGGTATVNGGIQQESNSPNLDLGSPYAIQLGFEGVAEYDPSQDKEHQQENSHGEKTCSNANDNDGEGNGRSGGGKKKKKSSKRKKKK